MTRAISPVVGTVLLVAVTVTLAAVAGTMVLDADAGEPTPQASLSVSADAGADRIVLTHEGGDTLSTTDLTVRISVDGQPLTHQPPIPYFAARGFESGPTGPFNPAADPGWSAGETASLRIASTNAPLLDPGSTVSVTVSNERGVVADLRTEAT